MPLTRLLLLALLLRAYVPVGFMPAAGSPFLLEPCHAAMGGHHHPGGHGQSDACPFGSAPAAGPALSVLAFAPAAAAAVTAALPPRSPPPTTRPQRAYAPRGPPPAPLV